MTNPDPMTELVESIADSLGRIADALELLCMSQTEMAVASAGDRPAIYEALRHIAMNVDRP